MRHLRRNRERSSIDLAVQRIVRRIGNEISEMAYSEAVELTPAPEGELGRVELRQVDRVAKEIEEKVINRLYHGGER